MKFKLTSNCKQYKGKTLYRIVALKTFNGVNEGDLGGFVESIDNLSQSGDCWIYDDASARGSSIVYGNARLFDNAEVADAAMIYDEAVVRDQASVYGNAQVYENAEVWGMATICGQEKIHGSSSIMAECHGSATVCSCRAERPFST